MATRKAAVTKTTKAVKKAPARAPGKQVASKRAASTNGAGRSTATKAATAQTKTATKTTASKATATRTATKKAIQKPVVPRMSAAKPAAARGSASKIITKPPSKAASKTITRTPSKSVKTAGKPLGKTPLRATSAAAATPSLAPTRPATRKAAAGSKPRQITREQALANTRRLLEAKHEHDRQPQPWQALDPQQSHVAEAGFQSPDAIAKAEELHAGESRQNAIQGSISTRDRHNQGKRDNR